MKEKNASILDSLPSLLGPFPILSFKKNWSLKRELPPLKKANNQSIDKVKCSNIKDNLNQKEEKLTWQNQSENLLRDSSCNHFKRSHQTICLVCLYQKTKVEKIAKCGHTDSLVFIRNMCKSCYKFSKKTNKKREKKSDS